MTTPPVSFSVRKLLRDLFATALLAFACVCPTLAQRLPDTVIPAHYTLKLTPDLKTAVFSGVESIDVNIKQPTRTITLNAIEIAFQSVTVGAGGSRDTGTVSLDNDKQQATFTFPDDSGRPRHAADSLHRHPQQRAARLLSLQDRQAQLRRHAV
jgi:hypothetical protein